MIQRIQSLLLLLGAGLMWGTLGLPFAKSSAKVAGSAYFDDGVYQAQDHPILLVLFGLSGLLALSAIFIYRKRLLQMRLTLFAAIAGIIAAGVTVLFFWQDSKAIQGAFGIQDGVGAYLPFLGLIALFLAYRYIGKDEKLVRSMDRLR